MPTACSRRELDAAEMTATVAQCLIPPHATIWRIHFSNLITLDNGAFERIGHGAVAISCPADVSPQTTKSSLKKRHWPAILA